MLFLAKCTLPDSFFAMLSPFFTCLMMFNFADHEGNSDLLVTS